MPKRKSIIAGFGENAITQGPFLYHFDWQIISMAGQKQNRPAQEDKGTQVDTAQTC